MELTIKEKEWYEILRKAGLDEGNSNQMARIKCLCDEFRESFPDAISDLNELFNQEGPFYQFCIDSGRFTCDEISSTFQYLFRSLQSTDNSYDNPFSIHYNPAEALWGYFKNIFK